MPYITDLNNQLLQAGHKLESCNLQIQSLEEHHASAAKEIKGLQERNNNQAETITELNNQLIDLQKELDERWLALFNIYYKHRSQISRINLWGISDGGSWLNGWPIAGRTNYPLLFDRQYRPKPVVNEIIKLYK